MDTPEKSLSKMYQSLKRCYFDVTKELHFKDKALTESLEENALLKSEVKYLTKILGRLDRGRV